MIGISGAVALGVVYAYDAGMVPMTKGPSKA